MDCSPLTVTKELYRNWVRVVGNVFKTNKKKYAFTYHTHELWGPLPQEMMKVRSISRHKNQFDKLMEKRFTKGYLTQQRGYSKIPLAQTGRCWVRTSEEGLFVLAPFLYPEHPLLIAHSKIGAGWTFNLTQPGCSHVFNRADLAWSVFESSHAISSDSCAVEVAQRLGKGIAGHSLLFIHVGKAQAPMTASYWIACPKIKILSKSHIGG